MGTHDELVAQDGLYRRLWQIQGVLAEDLRMEMVDDIGGDRIDGNATHRRVGRDVRGGGEPMSASPMEEEIFTGKMDFALWRKMLRFAIPHKTKILSVMALGALVPCFDMCLPFLTGRIVDTVSAQVHRRNCGNTCSFMRRSSSRFARCICSVHRGCRADDRCRSAMTFARPASTSFSGCHTPITTAKPSGG